MTTGPGQDDHAYDHLAAIGAALTAGAARPGTVHRHPLAAGEDHFHPERAWFVPICLRHR